MMLYLLSFDLCLNKPMILYLLISQGRWSGKINATVAWHAFHLNVIKMFYPSLLENLVLHAEFPACKSLSWSRTFSTRGLLAMNFPHNPQGYLYSQIHVDQRPKRFYYSRKFKKFTFCNTPENFCLTFKPAIPAKDDPCYGSWHGQPGSLRPGTSRFRSEATRVTWGQDL